MWMWFLLQIAKRYDIILIQEIRDISETTIPTYVDAINADIGFVACNTDHLLSFLNFSLFVLLYYINIARLLLPFEFWTFANFY